MTNQNHIMRVGGTYPELIPCTEVLVQLGLLAEPTDEFTEAVEVAVETFQADCGILVDGVIGPVTLAKLGVTVPDDGDEGEDQDEPPKPEKKRLALVVVRADLIELRGKTGLASWRVREDIAPSLLEILAICHAAGVQVGSAGGLRNLNAKVTSNRSATSFHYAGLAIDLDTRVAMVNLATDLFYVVREGRYFRLYAKATPGTPGVVQLSLDACYIYGRSVRTETITEHVLDVTQLFLDRGWNRVPPRRRLFTEGDHMAGEWWHFQHEGTLQRGVTTFGDALLTIYSEDDVDSTPPWKFRSAVFGKGWN